MKQVTIVCPGCSGFGGFRLVTLTGSIRKPCEVCQGEGTLTPKPVVNLTKLNLV
jgi:DnaJ-class molecular chaperone